LESVVSQGTIHYILMNLETRHKCIWKICPRIGRNVSPQMRCSLAHRGSLVASHSCSTPVCFTCLKPHDVYLRP
jgi:hypothetical protein